ncbi:hypothetical protein [Streptacidiphilus carbonis]|uniref:hypothetical protein n=1 Tax=Streptacidiphilus carbonis TaxID=105422 RepID=UPI001F45A3DE|nr:hypothetical protein [Streptacidiphilus carbonis]
MPKPGPVPRRPAAPLHPHSTAPAAPVAPVPSAPVASAPAASPASRPAPPAVEIQSVPAGAEGALDRADDSVDLLLDAGRRPGEVLVLTTGEAHPWQQHEQSFGAERYWAQLDEGDDVFYAEAAQCRPVRREVVVLAVNGGSPTVARQALAAALERATRLVVLCGDPGLIPAQQG